MSGQRNARPVSGEIMTAVSPGAVPSRPDPAFDVVDAEFETLDARAAAAAGRRQTSSWREAASAPGMAVLSRDRSARAPFGSTSAGAPFWIAGICAAAVAFWISGGHALLRQAPFFWPSATAKPLHIADLSSRVDASGGRAMLAVDGQAVNDGGDILPMPALKIDVISGDGATTRYNLGTSGSPIVPGEKFAFASRLPVPTNGVKSVSVTFGEFGE
jgi:hypothetical protein